MNVFAPDGLVARKEGSTWNQFVFDLQGNTVQKLTTSQSVSATRLTDAWGEGVETTTPKQIDPFLFNGKWGYYYDRESALYLCQHRMYDASAGRWINRDPIGYAGGLNLYGYCAGGPVGSADPWGFNQIDKAGVVVAMGETVPGTAEQIYTRIPDAIKWLARTGTSKGGRVLGPAATTILADGDSSEIQLAENAAMSALRVGLERACDVGTRFHSGFFAAFKQDPNYLVNQRIPGTLLRPDLLDKALKTIIELKPDNERALNDAMLQLSRYLEAARGHWGGEGWRGIIIPYTSPWSPGSWRPFW